MQKTARQRIIEQAATETAHAEHETDIGARILAAAVIGAFAWAGIMSVPSPAAPTHHHHVVTIAELVHR